MYTQRLYRDTPAVALPADAAPSHAHLYFHAAAAAVVVVAAGV